MSCTFSFELRPRVRLTQTLTPSSFLFACPKRLVRYFDGKITLQEMQYKENMSRREVNHVLKKFEKHVSLSLAPLATLVPSLSMADRLSPLDVAFLTKLITTNHT